MMWSRSVELMNAQYTSILGDGDAAVISALNTLQPYGADVVVQKHECINHMSKRMYKGLENVIKESTGHAKEARGKATTSTRGKASKSDAKTPVTTSLRGKGKLTAVRMKKWSQYFRNAIVKRTRQTSKLPEMQSGPSTIIVCRHPMILTTPTVILSGVSTCRPQQRVLSPKRGGRKANATSLFPEMPLRSCFRSLSA